MCNNYEKRILWILKRNPGCVLALDWHVGWHPGHEFWLSSQAMHDYEAMLMSRNDKYWYAVYVFTKYYSLCENSCHNSFLSLLSQCFRWIPAYPVSLLAHSASSDCGSPRSVLGQFMWNLWWTECQWAGFLWVLWFTLPILVVPNAPFLLSIIQVWYSGLFMASVPRDWGAPCPKMK
jgi:hypothetical protein